MTVETFVKRSTTVPTLHEAWGFVMGEVDRFTHPSISIQPFTRFSYSADDDTGEQLYDVTVSGITDPPEDT